MKYNRCIWMFLFQETMLGATCLYLGCMLLALILTFFMTYETKGQVQLDNMSRNSKDGSPEEDEKIPIKPTNKSPPTPTPTPTSKDEEKVAEVPAAQNNIQAEAPPPEITKTEATEDSK